jgi:hypothetical protein
MWAITERGLEEVEALYGGRSGFDTTKVMEVVYSYCINCYHFKDHLKKDASVPVIAQQGVEAYVDSCSALTLCGDIANTIKHRNREPGARSARITSISSSRTATIGWTEPRTGKSGSRDVLDLARAAADRWRAYLLQYGLQ